MKITKIKIKNFRQYKNCEVEFDNSFTSLMGENGTGKSALRIAFIFAMYGTEYLFEKKFFEDVTNKRELVNLCNSHHKNEDIKVEVFLTDSSDNNYVVTNSLSFPIEATYFSDPRVIVSRVSDNFDSKEIKYKEFLRKYPKKLAMFSIIHGEKLNSVALVVGKSKGNIDLKNEIEDITQMSVLRDKLKIVEKTTKSIKEQIIKSTEINQEITKLYEEQVKHEEEIEQLKEAIHGFEESVTGYEKLIEENNLLLEKNDEIRRVNSEIEKLKLEKQALEDKKNILSVNVDNDMFKDIFQLKVSSFFLKNVMFDSNSNKSFPGITKQTIDHLVSLDDCICGNKLTEMELENLNTLKCKPQATKIFEEVSKKMELYEEQTNTSKVKFEEDLIKIYELDTELNNVKSDLKKLTSSLNVLEAEEDAAKIVEHLSECKSAVNSLKEKINDYNIKIMALDELIERCKKESNKLKRNERTYSILLDSDKLLEQAEKEIKSQLKKMEKDLKYFLENSTNEMINRILKDGSKVSIGKNFIPTLEFENGATAASDGQNDVISICYVLGLLDTINEFGGRYGGILPDNVDLFPIILDGIFGKLDKHNIDLVMSQINKLPTQVIMMNSDEKLESVAKYFKKDIKQYIITREKNSNESRIDLYE